jgi:hypothetical protein
MAIRLLTVIVLALLAVAAPAGSSPGNGDRRQSATPETRPAPIRILGTLATKRGVLVRVTIPRGTPDGTLRARLWTRNMGVLLGQRRVLVLNGTRSRRFHIPLNRYAKRLLGRVHRLRVKGTARVPAPR